MTGAGREPPGGRPRRAGPALAASALGAGLGAALLAGCAPRTVTEQGRAIEHLYNAFLAAAVVVWGLVTGLMLWAIVRYRARARRLPPQIHGNNRLELAWTVVPAIVVLVLFVLSFAAQHRVTAMVPAPSARIDVQAFQWQWQFRHLGPDGRVRRDVIGVPGRRPVLVVPVGRTVRFRLTSADVTHSFFVPRSMYKRMAIPGRVNEFDLTFDVAGRFAGNCAQYCGLDHSQMLFDVEAVSPERYEAYLRGAAAEAP